MLGADPLSQLRRRHLQACQPPFKRLLTLSATQFDDFAQPTAGGTGAVKALERHRVKDVNHLEIGVRRQLHSVLKSVLGAIGEIERHQHPLIRLNL